MKISKDYTKLCFTNEWTLAASINPKLIWAGLKTFGLASLTKKILDFGQIAIFSVEKSFLVRFKTTLNRDHNIVVLTQSYFGLKYVPFISYVRL